MRSKKLKKAFTLVELVVVIAVIAVLAGVSVGAYFGITEMANKSAAFQHVKQMNDMLVISRIQDGKSNNTFHEARRDVQKQGMFILELKEFGGHKYGWDRTKDEFVVVNMTPNEESGKYSVVAPTEYEITNPRDIFVIATRTSDFAGAFSYYLHDNFEMPDSGEITVNGGVDTGILKFNKINYINTANENTTVLINNQFYGTELHVDGKTNGSVIHRGFAHKVVVDSCNSVVVNEEESKSIGYIENGFVGTLTINNGRLVTTNESKIFVVNHSLTDENIILSSSNTSTVNPDPNNYACAGGHTKDDAMLFPDFKNVYKVCIHCGKTLNYSCDTITDTQPESFGWLFNDLEYVSHNLHCNHETIKPSGKNEEIDGKKVNSETCDRCKLTYFTTESEHNYSTQIIEGVTWYFCSCGICENGVVPKAQVSEMTIEDKNNIFYNYLNTDYMFIPQPMGEGPMLINISEGINLSDYRLSDYSCGYKFTAVDSSETLMTSLYKDWQADFVVSVSKTVANRSVALWGQYSIGCVGIEIDEEITPSTNLPLLSGFGMTYNYADVVNEVKTFYCGAVNFSDKNLASNENGAALELYVELVIYNKSVIENQYGFDNFTEFLNSGIDLKNCSDAYISLDQFSHTFTDKIPHPLGLFDNEGQETNP